MTKAKELSNRERAKETSREIAEHYACWPEGCTARIERAIDEAEKRGKIEGQKEMRERATNLVEEFSWTLPLSSKREINEATDDAACEVCDQAGKAIRALLIEGE